MSNKYLHVGENGSIEPADIVVLSLMWHINNMTKVSHDVYETPTNKIHLLSGLLSTLEFYTTRSEFHELTKDLKVKMKPYQKTV